MKFRALPAFAVDFSRLPAPHRRMFIERMPAFSAGCDRWVTEGPHPWPGNLRVHRLANSRIWLMTWHDLRPDRRATFSFVEVNGHTLVEWRRVGGHDIYDDD